MDWAKMLSLTAWHYLAVGIKAIPQGQFKPRGMNSLIVD